MGRLPDALPSWLGGRAKEGECCACGCRPEAARLGQSANMEPGRGPRPNSARPDGRREVGTRNRIKFSQLVVVDDAHAAHSLYGTRNRRTSQPALFAEEQAPVGLLSELERDSDFPAVIICNWSFCAVKLQGIFLVKATK